MHDTSWNPVAGSGSVAISAGGLSHLWLKNASNQSKCVQNGVKTIEIARFRALVAIGPVRFRTDFAQTFLSTEGLEGVPGPSLNQSRLNAVTI